MAPIFKFPTGSPVPFDLLDVPVLCPGVGQTEADTAPRSELATDHGEQSPKAGWERSEKAGRARSSLPCSKKPLSGEYHHHQILSWKVTVSDRGMGRAKQTRLPCRGAVTPAGQPEGLPKPISLLHTEHPASSAQTSQPLQVLPPAHIPVASGEPAPCHSSDTIQASAAAQSSSWCHF